MTICGLSFVMISTFLTFGSESYFRAGIDNAGGFPCKSAIFVQCHPDRYYYIEWR